MPKLQMADNDLITAMQLYDEALTPYIRTPSVPHLDGSGKWNRNDNLSVCI